MAESSYKFSQIATARLSKLLAAIFNTSTGHDHDGVNSKAVSLAAGAVGTAALAAGAVTKAKAALFVSTEQTGTGAPQNVAHGLSAVPAFVFVAPTDLAPATVGDYTVAEGAHNATNVILTVTSGKKFKVIAMA